MLLTFVVAVVCSVLLCCVQCEIGFAGLFFFFLIRIIVWLNGPSEKFIGSMKLPSLALDRLLFFVKLPSLALDRLLFFVKLPTLTPLDRPLFFVKLPCRSLLCDRFQVICDDRGHVRCWTDWRGLRLPWRLDRGSPQFVIHSCWGCLIMYVVYWWKLNWE